MKIIKLVFIWLLITAYLFIISGFISDREDDLLCNAIEIRIMDSLNNKFINRNDIVTIFEENNINILGYPVNNIDLKKLELLLMNNRQIRNSEIYITKKGRLNIEVVQHKPIVRIINRKNESYYLGGDGTIIPLSERFCPYVIVVSGNIHEPFNAHQVNNIQEYMTDSLSTKEKVIYDVFRLVKYIYGNEFWNSQIVQVYVNDKNEFELIPRVGPHIIEFGSINDIEEKFEKLVTLYLKLFNKTDWNKYTRISVKYKNQIICIKS
jgi:cell division protein FtsQ